MEIKFLESLSNECPWPRPSKFDGQQNPCQIKNWINEMETSCSFLSGHDTGWCVYARNYLIGNARTWYDDWNPRKDGRPWKDFVNALKAYFYPPGYSIMMDRAFEQMKYKTTIFDYNTRFFHVMHESSNAFKDHEFLKIHYKKGLPEHIKTYLDQGSYRTLHELMTAAQVWEKEFDSEKFDDSVFYLQELVNP